MAGRRIELFVHLVWATWRRWPLLVGARRSDAHEAIGVKVRRLGCAPLAVGGTANHVHVLVAHSPAVSIARLVGESKGFSSWYVAHGQPGGRLFRWQEGYGAFSVAASDLPAVTRYVLDQERHHAERTLVADLECSEDD